MDLHFCNFSASEIWHDETGLESCKNMRLPESRKYKVLKRKMQYFMKKSSHPDGLWVDFDDRTTPNFEP